ncbi:MAG: cohesin domain-containing protein [Candidatus Roizmanbacteria bacterium]
MKNVSVFVSFIVVVSFFSVICAGSVFSAYLEFQPPSLSVAPGGSFDVNINLNTGGATNISSADVILLYNSSALQLQSVTDGALFDSFISNTVSGKISMVGTSSSGNAISNGLFAKIKFSSLQAGSTTATFNCSSSASDSSAISGAEGADTKDYIVCAQNGILTINSSGTSSTTPIPTTTTSSGTTTTTTTPTQLPRTGIVENLFFIAIPGLVLVLSGGLLRLFSKAMRFR